MVVRVGIVAAKLFIGGACIGYGTLSAARHAPKLLMTTPLGTRLAISEFRSHRLISDRKDGSRPPLAGIAIAAAASARYGFRYAREPLLNSLNIMKIGGYILSIAAK